MKEIPARYIYEGNSNGQKTFFLTKNAVFSGPKKVKIFDQNFVIFYYMADVNLVSWFIYEGKSMCLFAADNFFFGPKYVFGTSFLFFIFRPDTTNDHMSSDLFMKEIQFFLWHQTNVRTCSFCIFCSRFIVIWLFCALASPWMAFLLRKFLLCHQTDARTWPSGMFFRVMIVISQFCAMGSPCMGLFLKTANLSEKVGWSYRSRFIYEGKSQGMRVQKVRSKCFFGAFQQPPHDCEILNYPA